MTHLHVNLSSKWLKTAIVINRKAPHVQSTHTYKAYLHTHGSTKFWRNQSWWQHVSPRYL